jgi:hypothetical protein
LLDDSIRALQDFLILPWIERTRRFRVSMNDPWMKQGKRLYELSQFCGVVKEARAAQKSG